MMALRAKNPPKLWSSRPANSRATALERRAPASLDPSTKPAHAPGIRDRAERGAVPLSVASISRSQSRARRPDFGRDRRSREALHGRLQSGSTSRQATTSPHQYSQGSIPPTAMTILPQSACGAAVPCTPRHTAVRGVALANCTKIIGRRLPSVLDVRPRGERFKREPYAQMVQKQWL